MAQYNKMENTFITFWTEFFEKSRSGVETYAPRATLVVVVFLSLFFVAQLFKLYSNRKVDVNLYRKPTPEAVTLYNRTRRKILIGRFFWLLFVVLAWTAALATSGVDIRTVLEGLGFLGVALSLSLSTIIQQYIAGFLILNQHHFNIGEQIKVGKTSGVIKAIEARYTILRDFKENEVMVPNTDILNKAVVISEVGGLHRDVIRVRVANKSDFRRAIEVGEHAIAATMDVDKSVAPRGYVRYFGDSTQLAFYYTGLASRREHFILRSNVMINLKEAFESDGIEISYPSGIKVEESEED